MLTNLHTEQREIKTKKNIILVVLCTQFQPVHPIPKAEKSKLE